jgi:rhamnulose-1-phosphate aldolase
MEERMSLNESYPNLHELLDSIGEAGARMSALAATAGAAGNLSLCVGWELDVRLHFPVAESYALPQPAPDLAGKLILVTGSGCRLRQTCHARLGRLDAPADS